MKSDFLSSQRISVSTAREPANSGSLSHANCCGNTPLEVLVGRWPTSLIESCESALFSRRYGCMELSSSSCAKIGVPIDLRRVSQRISGIAQSKPSQFSWMMGNGALL